MGSNSVGPNTLSALDATQTGKEKSISISKSEGQVIAKEVRFGLIQEIWVESWKEENKQMNYRGATVAKKSV